MTSLQDVGILLGFSSSYRRRGCSRGNWLAFSIYSLVCANEEQLKTHQYSGHGFMRIKFMATSLSEIYHVAAASEDSWNTK
jgi:hypothetical protein